MRRHLLQRIAAFCTAVLLFSISEFQPIPVEGYDIAALTIAQVSVTEEELEQTQTVAVDVQIAANTEGFLAAEFGILYDTALTLDSVDFGDGTGSCFQYACNPDSGVIWFTGASSSAENTANSEEETLFTLFFTLPENASVGDSYAIDFLWKALDGSSAFWYIGNHTNCIGNVQSASRSGSITIPDPSAPALDHAELQVHIGGTKQLSVLNYEESVTWFSDNTQIATVTDGAITGVTAGSCRVYAYLSSGTLLSCNIKVTEEAYYDMTETNIVYLTDPEQVVYLQLPESETLQTITWISDNTSIVTVDNGKLQGIQNGAASVYAILGSQVYVTQVVVDYPEDYVSGDVDLDGTVSIMDVILLSQSLMGTEQLSEQAALAADAYYNHQIDSMDMLSILKYLVGLESALPIVPSTD